MKSLLSIIFLCISLNQYSQVKEISLNKNWKFKKVSDSAWLPATVPGTVHTDLLANKKIQDPFEAGSEKQLQWIEASDWEYATVFVCDKSALQHQNAELEFGGLDTYAKVYLNDSLILTASNMFRAWNLEVKKYLKEGENKLKVYFESAVNKGKELAKKLPYELPEGERVFTRKAQYQYGWDFAPRFVTCGIWKDVKLVMWNFARLGDVLVTQDSVDGKAALLTFNCEVNCSRQGEYRILISRENNISAGTTRSIFNTPVNTGKHSYDLSYTIMDPKLWWCNGLGRPNKYHFKVELLKGEKVIDKKSISIGVRKIELIREKDSVGRNFYFKLNGIPVFMKGANFIPPDIFLPRVKKGDYGKIVQSAVDANMNMLRVWGGGTYADEEFYKLCDANGILVWQDLMFACAMYPGDTAFTNNVKEEVTQQVKRLFNHPCVALWCGNNESDEGWKNWGWQKQFKYTKTDSEKIWSDYTGLFEKIIPDAMKIPYGKLQRPYISSSPKIGWGHKESLREGDSHYWGVWWGMEPFESYTKKVGRFMSEYGFQGMPSLESIKSICSYPIKPTTACLNSIQKHPKGFETINEYLKRDYKEPNGFENFVYVSQLLQARGLETAIEAHRRAIPYCMGSLYWQLNDCWPGITWSSIDHSGNWKAAHYSVKKVFSPIIISLEEKGDTITAYLLSDMRRYLGGRLTLKLYDLSGKELWEDEINIREFKDHFEQQVILPLSKKKYKRGDLVLKADWQSFTSSVPPAHALHYFVAPKALELQRPDIKIEWLDKHMICLTTNTLAKNVFLDGGDGVFFNDNYFDLLPGDKVFVSVKYPKGKRPAIKLITLIDTY